MKKLFPIIAFFLSISFYTHAQWLWNTEQMHEIKSNLHSLTYSTAYRELLKQAEKKLTEPDYSVTYKKYLPPSGDKHDYVSLSRYWWADSSKPDGLPYVHRDGRSNPELNEYDRNRLGEMCDAVNVLSLAYFYSNDERYAKKAVELIRTWFIAKETRMNPNLNYSQFVPGRNDSKGSAVGLVDTHSFVVMLNSIELLNKSKNYTRKDKKELQKWFSALAEWFVSSENGKKENAAANNHGTGFDAQLLTYYRFTANTKEAQKLIDAFAEKRIFTQIEPDGKQPHELRRTLAFHYSDYNIGFINDFLITAKTAGTEIYKNQQGVKERYLSALDFLSQYLGKDLEDWKPYQQISGWHSAQQNFCRNLYRFVQLLDPSQTAYLEKYREFADHNLSDRNRLLYGAEDPIEETFQFAARQLNFALACTEKTVQNSDEKKRNYNPRSTEKDGSLRIVSPRDWCSGFFPGTLWYMYQYTNDESWKQQAEKYSQNIEGEKFDRTSHDVGFKMNCSFGNAYKLTNNSEYKDVLIQSAKTLSRRFNSKVGLIRSWDWNRDVWQYPVIVDNMMNLELLFEATKLSGDSIYYKIAETHAETTLKHHFRDDFSSFHVVDYSPETGEVLKKQTFQGYADPTAWARGQAWGLYGFVMSYRYTQNPEFLKIAENIAGFVFSHPNLPKDFIPYWDFNDPAIPNAPRDASSACIMASSLYELASYSSVNSEKYIAWADKILSSLIYRYRAPLETNQGFLLLHSTGNHPGNDEIDVSINYADYYFMEALTRRNEIKKNR